MGYKRATGPSPKGDKARACDQLPGQIDAETNGLRRGVQAITTPKEAVQAMVDAGAVFSVHQRADSLGMSFTYRVDPGGDIERARAILAMVKARPPAFLVAFKAMVQQVAGPLD